jgi:hypothetical protein
MPEIVGKFTTLSSTVAPIDAHIGLLRHLGNRKIANTLLQTKFGFTAGDAKNSASRFCAHIEQAINFYEESRKSTVRIRPVLQYYSYLNLAVAVILAYRPSNYNQYRRHGVEDLSHQLNKFELSSEVIKVKTGAVPLFHSILSDERLNNRKLRFGHLVAGFPMLSHELHVLYGKHTQKIFVAESVEANAGNYHSRIRFESHIDLQKAPISYNRLEKAMPLLVTHYRRQPQSPNPIIYDSVQTWASHITAINHHRRNCFKLINYGGHSLTRQGVNTAYDYMWHGVSRVNLLPTLTSILLLSFSLASIVRYRPELLNSALSSQYQILIETFAQESDGVFIPALRNLLYREESCMSERDFL